MADSRPNGPKSKRLRFLSQIIDSASLPFFAFDQESFVYVNPAFAEMLAYEPSELLTISPERVLADERGLLPRSLSDPHGPDHFWTTVTWSKRDGTAVHTAVHGSFVNAASRRVVLGTAETHDVADAAAEEVNRLHDAIEHAAMEWRVTVDSLDTPVIVLDGNGMVSRINRAARMIAGKSFAEVVAHPLESLGDTEPWKVMGALMSDVKVSGAPAPAQVVDDEGRTWDLLAMPLKLEVPDAEQRVIITAWDVTAIVKLQASIAHFETLSLMGALVAGVAHEVRNPLFAISANLDALEQVSAGEHAEYFSVLREEVERMTRLMQDLLAYGSPAEPALSHIESDGVLNKAIRGCQAVANANAIRVELSSFWNAALLADEERLARAFQNVIENAIQHSPRGEKVMIATDRSEDGGQEWLEIRVSDHGSGIHPDDLAHIFEPFFSKRRGGTGLGLSIVQKTIEEHGGVIRAQNRAEGGAEMTIRLPVSRARHRKETSRGTA